VTPRPQPGNTPPVVARDLARRALWNRMGFPSRGADVVQRRLQALASPRPTPLFANIGKNAATPLEAAADDYIDLLRRLRGLVDGFVVNISSPNTKGLRDLLQPERLTDFLRPLVAERREPLLLKISPDLDDEDLARVLTISHDLGIDGWILTNTSQGLREGLSFPKEGGVSGSPLAARSTDVLRRSLALLGARRAGKLIVSVGGVMSPADVRERLALGADLVQVYSALIFEGPYFFRKVARWQRVNPPA
jgi:dihydroorotate dehydrogenase